VEERKTQNKIKERKKERKRHESETGLRSEINEEIYVTNIDEA